MPLFSRSAVFYATLAVTSALCSVSVSGSTLTPGRADVEVTIDLAALHLASVESAREEGRITFYKPSDGLRGRTLHIAEPRVDLASGMLLARINDAAQFSEIMEISELKPGVGGRVNANAVATDLLERELGALFASRQLSLSQATFGRVSFDASPPPSSIPLPASITLMLVALIGLMIVRRRVAT